MRFLRSLGPAIVVAAVVLGPGSILTASKTGAQYGYGMGWVLAVAVLLMIGTCALSSRLGALLPGTPCDELAEGLGRPVALFVGAIVFLIAAGFQTSNNLAVAKALAPHLSEGQQGWVPVAALLALNAALVAIVYRSRSLYRPVEIAMKGLVGLMIIAFVANAIAVRPSLPKALGGLVPKVPEGDVLVLLGLVATTFSIAGAFYQAYLVRDKGWRLPELERTFFDSVVGMLVLGAVTFLIMITSAATLSGRQGELATVSDVAAQLDGLFGAWAGIVFTVGIFAGALSSFLVNAMIGGRLLADGIGKGGTSEARWARHGTALALLAGLAGGLVGHLQSGGGKLAPIVVAQASTILGGPALAAALLYLSTRKRDGAAVAPRWMTATAAIALLVSLGLAARTLRSLLG